MATLPTYLTEKQIADLPWLNDAARGISPRLVVTDHSTQDIAKFRDAMNANNIPTKLINAGDTSYVAAAVDVPGVEKHLATIRIKYLPLEDVNGKIVDSYRQFNSNTPLTRKDNLFTDLHPDAKAGARIENPAALRSIQDLFRQAEHFGIEVENGKLIIQGGEANNRLFQKVGKFTGESTGKFHFHDTNYAEIKAPIETPSFIQTAKYIIENNRLNVGLGALIVTADAALAAAPALSEGKYADAAVLALNSTARLATEAVVIANCTSEVAAAAAPLLADPPIYAAAVTAGAGVCASGMNNIMTYGEKGMEAIEARVKEVAANNGLDPDHIWASILQKAKEESTAPAENQPAYEP